MKILIAYYSRTGTTKKIAELIQKELNCDIEEINDLEKHSGVIGWIKGAFESLMEKSCKIKTTTKNPADYNLVIIGSPVWASKLSSPMYAYTQKFKNDFKEIACFTTCGGKGYEGTFKQVENITKLDLKAEMYITKATIDNPKPEIEKFIKKVK